MKRWVVGHPLWFCAGATACWYALLLVHPLLAAVLPVGLVWSLGWWRETGLRWQRPNKQWLLVLPPLAVCAALLGPLSVPLAVSSEIANRGLGQYALRRFGPWQVSIMLTGLSAAADVAAGQSVALALAAGFCLTALRWRLNTVWPLVVLHAFLPHTGSWWLVAGLVAYGCWLLRGYPVVRMEDRPTVRVACFDDGGRLLMIRWHDPSDGTSAWDLPGGGVEAGETPFAAARRELHEETGLSGDCVLDRFVTARRDAHWNNKRFVGAEPYYLARVEGDRPPLDHAGLEPHETSLIREFRWVPPEEATGIEGRLQLTTLPAVAARLIGSDSRRRPGDRSR